MLKLVQDLKKIHFESEKLALKAKQKGFKPRKILLSEREKLAKEFLSKKKFSKKFLCS